MPTQYIVQPGDCISSIAFQYGFFPDALWGHELNADLKNLRKEGNALLPGDIVAIPDKQNKEITKPAGKHYCFRRKGVPQFFQLQLLRGQAPRADCAYLLCVEDLQFEGRTDAEGWLKHWIAPDARRGKLVVDDQEEYLLKFGYLDPVTAETGVRTRLYNLGYLSSETAEDEAYRDAIRQFQQDQGLDAGGVMNPETEAKLVHCHTY